VSLSEIPADAPPSATNSEPAAICEHKSSSFFSKQSPELQALVYDFFHHDNPGNGTTVLQQRQAATLADFETSICSETASTASDFTDEDFSDDSSDEDA
jgi:hypothetical protein